MIITVHLPLKSSDDKGIAFSVNLKCDMSVHLSVANQ